MKIKLLSLALLISLAACGDDKPSIRVDSITKCETGTDVMVRMAQACAQGGGKYPEDCMSAAVKHFCPTVTGYSVRDAAYQSSAWRPCAEARSAEAKAACSAFEK